MVAERLASVQRQAAAHGRELRFRIRVHVITRDTEEDAWREAKRLLDNIPKGAIEDAQRNLGSMDSVGQARMQALHRGASSVAAWGSASSAPIQVGIAYVVTR